MMSTRPLWSIGAYGLLALALVEDPDLPRGTVQAAQSAQSATVPPAEQEKPDVVIRLGAIPNEMLFTEKALTVQAGQLVEIVFTNDDQMQHNVVLGTPASLEAIGAGADMLATQPGGNAVGFVPDIPQVLARTPLVDPGQSSTLRFRAPAQAGQYPYVCTFPAHWRIMNGILTVVAPASAGGQGTTGPGQ